MKNKVLLGTAGFGKDITFNESEKILDLFLTKFNRIQTATNYPIESNLPFNATLDFLEGYIKRNNVSCEVVINIGSLSNKFSNESDLSASFFYSNYLMLRHRFPNNELILSIHWDNEDSNRTELLKVFKELNCKIKIGLSGIKFPDNYLISDLQYTYQINSFLDRQSNFSLSSKIRNKLPIAELIGYQILGGNKVTENRLAKMSQVYEYSGKEKQNLLIKILNENFLKYDSLIIAPRNLDQASSWLSALESLYV
jgi:hypothetical protein